MDQPRKFAVTPRRDGRDVPHGRDVPPIRAWAGGLARALGTCCGAGLLALSLLVPAGPLPAQDGEEAPGRLQGQVLSAESAAPIQSAQVTLAGTEIGTLTDLNGRYTIRRVPAGAYTLVVRSLGYATKRVTGLQVSAGQATRLDVTLETEAVQMEEIRVTAEAERGSVAALLNRQRTAPSVTDAMGTRDISRSPASDAAEAASRITGVTLSEGKYVYIRGLGERYSQTTLSGSPLPSPEPEKSVVPLDLFPAGFLQSLTTRKTYTPDQPGDFSGGSVEIETKEFPETFTAKFSVGSSFNTQSQFDDGWIHYDGGNLDFLGFDDGSRALPALMEHELGGLDGEPLSGDPVLRERLGEALLPELSSFGVEGGTTPANSDWSFTLGDRTELAGKEFGYFVAGTYSNGYQLRTDEVERKWRSSAFDPTVADEVEPNVAYRFQKGLHQVRLGGIGNFTLVPSPDHQISLKTLYNRNTDDEARTFRGANREDLGGELRNERLRFIAREMKWAQLSGQHSLLDGARLEWRLTGARAGREEPGLRETVFKRPFSADPDDPFHLENTGESARYLFSELTDDELNGQVQWKLPLPGLDDEKAWFEVGGAGRLRDRDFAARRFRWQFQSGSNVTDLSSALDESSVVGQVRGPDQFALTEIVEPGDVYDAEDETTAGFLTVNLPVTRRLTVNAGARVERYDLNLTTRSDRLEDTELRSTDVLPALNVTYGLSDEMNLRAGVSRTLDRPEFRELAPFQFTEASSLRQLFGNPELDIAEIRNADLRWEWFPNPGEVLTMSVFYKDLERPIEKVFITTAGTAYSYQNAKDGQLYGAELGLRKGLGFLTPALEPLSFHGNVSVIESEVNVRTGGIFDPTRLQRPLEGQSDYAANASLVYQSSGGDTEGGLYLNVMGERVVAAGGSEVPDIVEAPRPQLDATFRHQLFRRVGLKLKATNLLDTAHEWTQTKNGITRVQRRFTTGQTVSVSFVYGQ